MITTCRDVFKTFIDKVYNSIEDVHLTNRTNKASNTSKTSKASKV